MELVVTQPLLDELKKVYEPRIRVEPLEASLKLLQLAAVRVMYMPPPEQWSPYVDRFQGFADDFSGE